MATALHHPDTDPSVQPIFTPFRLKGIALPNRIVMAPMTRKFSPDGVPGEDVASYYRRRAEAGVGLIVTEGIYLDQANAGQERPIPRLRRGAAETGWRRVVSQVHEAGGRIFAQLFHVGAHEMNNDLVDPSISLIGPSGMTGTGRQLAGAPSDRQVEELVEAFAAAASLAKQIGFDGIELHAGHGYLIDQFFWDVTNRRSDRWGGKDLVARTRFAVETVAACRAATGPDFPISFRFSQWKIVDYDARLAQTPDELARFLAPLADAGVDIFHCSTRRYWTPEFPGSDLNLAGWTKKLTGLPTIAVGSVTLATDLYQSPEHAEAARIDKLVEMLERDEFDLFAVGRALIANPDWPQIVRRGAFEELKPFDKATSRTELY